MVQIKKAVVVVVVGFLDLGLCATCIHYTLPTGILCLQCVGLPTGTCQWIICCIIAHCVQPTLRTLSRLLRAYSRCNLGHFAF